MAPPHTRVLLLSLALFGTLAVCSARLQGCMHVRRSRGAADTLVLHNEATDEVCADVMRARSIGVADNCIDADMTSISLGHQAATISLASSPHLLGPTFLYIRLYSGPGCSSSDYISRGVIDIHSGGKQKRRVRNHSVVRMTDGEKGTLAECIYMKNPRANGTKVLLLNYRDWKTLPHHYKQEGTCRRVVHTDSVRVNGVCSNLDFHPDNINRYRFCVAKFPDKKSIQYRKCIWAPWSVNRGGVVTTTGAKKGATLLVELFDDPDCVKRLVRGRITIRDE